MMQYAPLPVDLVVEVMMFAENELAALHSAALRIFGPEQAELAANDWCRELEVMEWLPESAIPNWRQPALAAVRRLAERTRGFPTPLAVQQPG